MKKLVLCAVLVFGLAGCFDLAKVKAKFQEATLQLDLSTKQCLEISKRLVDNPASVTAAEKKELIAYLKNTRKVTVALNVVVGNYEFQAAVKKLVDEGVLDIPDLWKLLKDGKINYDTYTLLTDSLKGGDDK